MMSSHFRLSIARVAGALALIGSAVCWASDITTDRPNQYPSPSVKQPAVEEKFSADWPWDINTLSGDWFGVRNQLAEHGVVVGIQYVSVMMQNTEGGFDPGFIGGGPLGATVTIDTEKLIGHEGGLVFFDWEYFSWYNHRYPPSGEEDPTGSYVGVNTNFIEADVLTLNQVAQLYYRQSFWDESLAVTFGKMDANVPFASVQAAGGFQNSLAMYTSTLNGYIPTYPNEATGLVVAGKASDSLSGKVGWFDGTTPGLNPTTGAVGPDTGPRGPRTFFDNEGHWLVMSQIDYSWQIDELRPGSAGVGAWLQTGLTATEGTDTAGVRDVPGLYVQWQQMLWSPSAELAADGGGIAYFGQFGWSDPNKNAIHWSLMTGVSATGVFTDRPADAVGIMFGYSNFTDNPGIYQSTLPNGDPGPPGGSETSIESFYIWQATPWAYMQPGVMWIADPSGGDPPALGDALLGYLVVGVQF